MDDDLSKVVVRRWTGRHTDIVYNTIKEHDSVRLSFRESKLYNGNFFNKMDELAKDLALYFANYECEHCHTQEFLTLHHIIRRNNRPFMNIVKYIIQRHDFRNMSILCYKCHGVVDGLKTDNQLEPQVISKDRIDEVKKRFGDA